ncbi:hypothetical protein D8674_024914 [Pyrus ussuriensis x Pyrus communis]|uniref:Uncharacterized protein n=1 Tax=Pyrus ussuriensis x Pyrus communis TaxID=2448454 RepID=A0A5N5H9D1_9ROSA|nr:hypothetical protein D8674_024914 [Pyrus ussuriensis x Pyrus communis]
MYEIQSPNIGLMSFDKPKVELAHLAFHLQSFGFLFSFWTWSDCLSLCASLDFSRTSPKPDNAGLLFSHSSGLSTAAYDLLGFSHPFGPKLQQVCILGYLATMSPSPMAYIFF